MPAIFHKANGEWRAERFVMTHAVLSFSPMRIIAFEAANSRFSGVELMRTGSGREWLAIIPQGMPLAHNGQEVTAGLRVLAHGDQLAAAHSEPVFFSTEEVACVEPFAGAEPVSCPRCKREIVPGQLSVRCPRCGVVHHELTGRLCWSYSKTCQLCRQSTALDMELSWTPDAL